MKGGVRIKLPADWLWISYFAPSLPQLCLQESRLVLACAFLLIALTKWSKSLGKRCQQHLVALNQNQCGYTHPCCPGLCGDHESVCCCGPNTIWPVLSLHQAEGRFFLAFDADFFCPISSQIQKPIECFWFCSLQAHWFCSLNHSYFKYGQSNLFLTMICCWKQYMVKKTYVLVNMYLICLMNRLYIYVHIFIYVYILHIYTFVCVLIYNI